MAATSGFFSMIGRTLGHYRIVDKIGAGGMGEVYRAHDQRLERDVALKVLPAHTLAEESARKRFRKEALTLSKLNHAHIAHVYEDHVRPMFPAGTVLIVSSYFDNTAENPPAALDFFQPSSEVARFCG